MLSFVLRHTALVLVLVLVEAGIRGGGGVCDFLRLQCVVVTHRMMASSCSSRSISLCTPACMVTQCVKREALS